MSDVELPGRATRSGTRRRCPAEVAARLPELASPRLVALGGPGGLINSGVAHVT